MPCASCLAVCARCAGAGSLPATASMAQEMVIVPTRVIYPGETITGDLVQEVPFDRAGRNLPPLAMVAADAVGKVTTRTLLPGTADPRGLAARRLCGRGRQAGTHDVRRAGTGDHRDRRCRCNPAPWATRSGAQSRQRRRHHRHRHGRRHHPGRRVMRAGHRPRRRRPARGLRSRRRADLATAAFGERAALRRADLGDAPSPLPELGGPVSRDQGHRHAAERARQPAHRLRARDRPAGQRRQPAQLAFHRAVDPRHAAEPRHRHRGRPGARQERRSSDRHRQPAALRPVGRPHRRHASPRSAMRPRSPAARW